MSLLGTTITLVVYLISPRDVFAGDHYNIDSLVDITSRELSLLKTTLDWQLGCYLPEMSF